MIRGSSRWGLTNDIANAAAVTAKWLISTRLVNPSYLVDDGIAVP